jgi:hypothetical protein
MIHGPVPKKLLLTLERDHKLFNVTIIKESANPAVTSEQKTEPEPASDKPATQESGK